MNNHDAIHALPDFGDTSSLTSKLRYHAVGATIGVFAVALSIIAILFAYIDQTKELSCIGVLKPASKVRVLVGISGVVESVAVRSGRVVKAGDSLGFVTPVEARPGPNGFRIVLATPGRPIVSPINGTVIGTPIERRVSSIVSEYDVAFEIATSDTMTVELIGTESVPFQVRQMDHVSMWLREDKTCVLDGEVVLTRTYEGESPLGQNVRARPRRLLVIAVGAPNLISKGIQERFVPGTEVRVNLRIGRWGTLSGILERIGLSRTLSR